MRIQLQRRLEHLLSRGRQEVGQLRVLYQDYLEDLHRLVDPRCAIVSIYSKATMKQPLLLRQLHRRRPLFQLLQLVELGRRIQVELDGELDENLKWLYFSSLEEEIERLNREIDELKRKKKGDEEELENQWKNRLLKKESDLKEEFSDERASLQ